MKSYLSYLFLMRKMCAVKIVHLSAKCTDRHINSFIYFYSQCQYHSQPTYFVYGLNKSFLGWVVTTFRINVSTYWSEFALNYLTWFEFTSSSLCNSFNAEKIWFCFGQNFVFCEACSVKPFFKNKFEMLFRVKNIQNWCTRTHFSW